MLYVRAFWPGFIKGVAARAKCAGTMFALRGLVQGGTFTQTVIRKESVAEIKPGHSTTRKGDAANVQVFDDDE